MKANEPADEPALPTSQNAEVLDDGDGQLPRPASTQRARDVLSPSLNAVAVLSSYSKFSNWSVEDMAAVTMELEANFQSVKSRDTSLAESMLMAQATALQAMFMNLARRAADQSHLVNSEGYLRMALKAQNQARATLESLYAIKNPPLVIARQANINNGGHQQVNNGEGPIARPRGSSSRAHAESSANAPNELLERSEHVTRLDRRKKGSAIGTHPDLGAMAEVHRSPLRRRKGSGST